MIRLPLKNDRWLAIALTAALLVLTGAHATFAAEAIQHYDQVVRVEPDGTLAVSETIRVHAEAAQIRHGIYRDFPLLTRDARGNIHEVGFHLIGITRDGQTEPYHTERQNDGIRIYAGSKNDLLPRGDHTYVIRYTTTRQLRWYGDRPELYWNVTGNFWRFPIEHATTRIELPGEARPLRWTAFTGPPGSRGKDWRASMQDGRTLTFETTRTLRGGEGLTIAALIPPGAVTPPSAATLFWYRIVDHRGWIIGAIGLLLVLGYFAWAWNAVGRDPKGGTIIPLFHPPDGVSPALANYIHNWGLGRERWRAFTAAALSLAVRGLLTFDHQGSTLTLTATAKTPGGLAALPPGERDILSWVQQQGGSAVIDRANGKNVAAIGTLFAASIERDNRKRFFNRNIGYFFGGLALSILTLVIIVADGGLRDADLVILFMSGFIGVFAGIFLFPVIQGLTGAGHGKAVRTALGVVVVIAVLGFAASWLMPARQHVGPLMESVAGAALMKVSAHPLPLALVLGFAVVNGLFFYLLRAPTDLGRKVMDQLDGLRLYLNTAEADRMNMQAPEFTAAHFESLLPYAVALDVEKPWSNAFAAALHRAHPEDADPMRSYRPGWYSGGNSTWSTADFGSSFSSTISGMSSAFVSAVPVSSGSGGGGSGGGGGGGGGGGW